MKVNELKCSDLRIGNYLKYNSKIVEVFGLRPRYIEYYDEDEFLVGDNPEYFEPIELTEELLVKIGFEKFEKLFRMKLREFHLDYFIVVGVLRIYKKITDCYFDKNLEIKCEFLHQLQNAYYLLTNEELEVEL